MCAPAHGEKRRAHLGGAPSPVLCSETSDAAERPSPPQPKVRIYANAMGGQQAGASSGAGGSKHTLGADHLSTSLPEPGTPGIGHQAQGYLAVAPPK